MLAQGPRDLTNPKTVARTGVGALVSAIAVFGVLFEFVSPALFIALGAAGVGAAAALCLAWRALRPSLARDATPAPLMPVGVVCIVVGLTWLPLGILEFVTPVSRGLIPAPHVTPIAQNTPTQTPTTTGSPTMTANPASTPSPTSTPAPSGIPQSSAGLQVPQAFVGAWVGTVQRYNGDDYAESLTIQAGALGDTVGAVNLPTLSCRGQFKLDKVDDHSLTVRESEISGGHYCWSDHVLVLVLTSTGTLSMTEYYSGPSDSSSFATAILTKTAGG